MDIVLRNLHLKASGLSVKQLYAVNWPNNLDVTS